MLSALIFDVDGTMADTESVHRAAFNYAFAEVGCGWVWDEVTYTRLLDISGGKERILHYWLQIEPDLNQTNSADVQDCVTRIHALKTAAYERAIMGNTLQLRPGVLRLIESAYHDGLRLAIATTTSSINIAALLRTTIGTDWRRYFLVIEDASTAPNKKPHPQVYLQALKGLQMNARGCLAFEDSANGLKAATRASLRTVITPTEFTADHDFSGALCVLPSLQDVTVSKLQAWHSRSHLFAAGPVHAS